MAGLGTWWLISKVDSPKSQTVVTSLLKNEQGNLDAIFTKKEKLTNNLKILKLLLQLNVNSEFKLSKII